MFRFENPSAFLWLWCVPAVVGLGVYLARRHERKIASVLGDRLRPFLTSSLSPARRKWKWMLEVLVLIFAVIALARPQMGTSQEEIKSQGIELLLAVDVSSSMLAEDVRPSRLDFAKREIFRLVDQLSGNKIGVVAFAGSAALVAPMTTDLAALKMYIDALSPDSVSSQGTEFKKALLESREAFKRGGVGPDEQAAVTRAILLLSDGEDNEPGALETAKELRKEGIRIFSLAFGTEKGAPIPVRDSQGEMRGYKKDTKGQTVLSQTKGTVLRELARTGDGSFYHVTFGGNAVDRVVSDINRLEKTEFENQMVTNYSERYQWILFFALVFALIELALGERFRGREIWRGRFEAPQR